MPRDIMKIVQAQYGAVAASDLSGSNKGVQAVAEAFGYSADDLRHIPADANMGLSCGNPTAFASLRAGETVVDLGCGGGMDVFLAAEKVGPTGKSIGIDMTPEMIERARKNAREGSGGKPIANVEFHLAKIDSLPLPDASADCILSNCVINLAPDKGAVFSEMYRVLRKGGRIAISDIALKKPLPAEIAEDVMALVGCFAGAISIADYRAGLLAAGFSGVEVVDSGSDLNAYAKVEGQSGCCAPAMVSSSALPIVSSSCCGGTSCATEPSLHGGLAELLARYDINDYAASVKIYAVK